VCVASGIGEPPRHTFGPAVNRITRTTSPKMSIALIKAETEVVALMASFIASMNGGPRACSSLIRAASRKGDDMEDYATPRCAAWSRRRADGNERRTSA
jgi:hypothetical protein